MNRNSITVEGKRIEVSNLDKVLFPQSGITKGDLIEYYSRISRHALVELRNRPIAMERFPNGIDKARFFQKTIPNHFPAWIERTALRKEGGTVTQVMVNNAATLVYLANQACITPHIFLSRANRLMTPDRFVFDLDPSDEDFSKVQRAAKIVKDAVEAFHLPTFVQSTGSRGLHVVVPLKCVETFDEVHAFARALAEHLVRRNPELLTVEQRKAKRGARVFVDYYRNSYAQLIVAPYSVRAREQAPIATPIEWSEALARDFTPRRYTIRNIFDRLRRKENPWAGIDRSVVSLRRAKKDLEATTQAEA